MVLKKLSHGNVKVCHLNSVLLPPLLIIAFLCQLNGTKKKTTLSAIFIGSCLKQKSFYSSKYINFFINELDTWPRDLNSDFILRDCLFGGVTLAESADPDIYIYTCYSFRFDLRSTFSLPGSSMGKNDSIFGADMSSSVHIDNKKKYSLIFSKGSTEGLGYSSLTEEAQYSINYSKSNKSICLSLHYNKSNIFVFVNATKIYQFKAKYSEIIKYLNLKKICFFLSKHEKKQD